MDIGVLLTVIASPRDRVAVEKTMNKLSETGTIGICVVIEAVELVVMDMRLVVSFDVGKETGSVRRESALDKSTIGISLIVAVPPGSIVCSSTTVPLLPSLSLQLFPEVLRVLVIAPVPVNSSVSEGDEFRSTSSPQSSLFCLPPSTLSSVRSESPPVDCIFPSLPEMPCILLVVVF